MSAAIRTGLAAFFVSVLAVTSCWLDDTTGPDVQGTDLDYLPFLKQEHGAIADTLARILGVAPVAFNQMVEKWDISVGLAGDQWVGEGYDYLAENGARITVWTDADGAPYAVTYHLRRGGEAGDWTYGADRAESTVVSILEQTGVVLGGTEGVRVSMYGAGPAAHWYNIAISQTFRGNLLYYPQNTAELVGDTGELSFLRLHRWHIGLSEIDDILSEEKLITAALDYFRSSPEVISIPDSLTLHGQCIVNDILCQNVRYAVIDEWGSRMHLFIDSQSGEVVDVERALVH